MSDNPFTNLSTVKTTVLAALCDNDRYYGLKATNPEFWVINPEFDEIKKLTHGRFKAYKGNLIGIYETRLFRWLIPVRYATVRQDRRGTYWVRQTEDSIEEVFETP